MANKKPSGLGRGLGALLGDDVLKPEAAGNLYLPISQVESCSTQPRKLFDEGALAELADSIREHGVFSPLLCVLCRGEAIRSSPGSGGGGPPGWRAYRRFQP